MEINNIGTGSEISIYNLSGELVDHYIYNQNKYSLKHLKAGIYLVEILQNLKKEHFKIIKF